MSLFNIVIGSYETPLYGFEGGIRMKGQGASAEAVLALREVFGYAAHIGCIKAVASCGKWLASSSTDEAVKYAFSAPEFPSPPKHREFFRH
jgi:protein MAK11